MTTTAKTMSKKFTSYLAYGIFGLVTLIIFGALIIWSALGVKEGVVTIYEAPLVVSEETPAQTEYLVGQKFNPDGISLNIGTDKKPELIPASDCEIDADFTSGGNKRVTITYSPDAYTSYKGYINVSVYFVRGLEVVTQPEIVTVLEDGTFTCDEDFKILAHLNTMPLDTEKFEPAGDNTVVLTPDMYTALAVESKQIDSYYTGSIYCGNLTYSFNFYNGAGRTFIINSERNIVTFENTNENSSATLTLVITDAPDTYQHESVGETVGYYIYTNENGETSVRDFAYELTETAEIFSSDGFVEAHANDAYTATYDGKTFAAASNVFQSAVVNGIILEDGPYLFVVESVDRTLQFIRVSDSEPQEGDPTLKVYVTYYEFNMSTGSGISKGFYVYTAANGEKYKIPFFMQTWVWDYVPLSIQHTSNPNQQVTDYLEAQYIGAIHAEIRIYSRTMGWLTDHFRAEFTDIRYAAYNTH